MCQINGVDIRELEETMANVITRQQKNIEKAMDYYRYLNEHREEENDQQEHQQVQNKNIRCCGNCIWYVNERKEGKNPCTAFGMEMYVNYDSHCGKFEPKKTKSKME
jgi:sulfur transfer protein SufE